MTDQVRDRVTNRHLPFQKMIEFLAMCKEYLRTCRGQNCSDDEKLYGFLDGSLNSVTQEQVDDKIKKSREDLKELLKNKMIR